MSSTSTIAAGVEQRASPIQILIFDADGRADPQVAPLVGGGFGILVGLDHILGRDQPDQVAVAVNDGQFFQPMLRRARREPFPA